MKSIFDVIGRAVPAAGDLKGFILTQRARLTALKGDFPDLAKQLDEDIAVIDAWVVVLDGVVSPEALIDLGKTVFNELADLKHGLKPAPHAGDLTGGG